MILPEHKLWEIDYYKVEQENPSFMKFQDVITIYWKGRPRLPWRWLSWWRYTPKPSRFKFDLIMHEYNKTDDVATFGHRRDYLQLKRQIDNHIKESACDVIESQINDILTS